MSESGNAGPDEGDARDFKASDLLKLAGLTYRQLSDWENRAGVLDSQRATDEGWRKFTGEEVLALCVCASLRTQFSLPLERVGGLAQWLLGKRSVRMELVSFDGANKWKPHAASLAKAGRETLAAVEKQIADLLSLGDESLARALKDDANRFKLSAYCQVKLLSLCDRPILYAHKLAELGFTIYLFTDFDDSAVVGADGLADFLAGRSRKKPFALCCLNSIFDTAKAKAGQTLLHSEKAAKLFSTYLREQKEHLPAQTAEGEVLRLIRAKNYNSVTVYKRQGQIIRAEAEEDLFTSSPAKCDADILQAIKGKDFSTVKVSRADGQTVGLMRKTTIKFDKVAGKS